MFIKRPQLTAVEKKAFFFVITIPWRNFLAKKNYVKEILLTSCKLQIVFKSQRKLSNVFRFKDRIPFHLVFGAVYKYTCGRIVFLSVMVKRIDT